MEKLLENEKSVIRSLLMPSPRGLMFQDFIKHYQEMIGQPLPYAKFGYKSPIFFLQNMPDVVKVMSHANDYLLTVVTNEQTEHIKKLVDKQKVSKQNKLPVLRKRARPSVALSNIRRPLPTRFQAMPRTQNAVQTQAPPRIQATQLHLSTMKPFLVPTAKLDIINLLKHKSWVSLKKFLEDFRRTYDKELNPGNYGFKTFQECIGTIKEIEHKKIDGQDYLRLANGNNVQEDGKKHSSLFSESTRMKFPAPDLINTHANVSGYYNPPVLNHCEVVEEHIKPPIFPPRLPEPEEYKTFKIPVTENKFSCSTSKISEGMEFEFRQVLDLNPHGIWAADFTESYEVLTENIFDFKELGFSSLIELFSSLPDIFRFYLPANCNCDFLVFDARVTEQDYSSKLFSDRSIDGDNTASINKIIADIRKLLQGCPEGVKLSQFVEVFNDSFENNFILSEFGFDNLKKFLMCIANHVPLRILHGQKNVKLGREITPALIHTKIASWKTSLQKKIPEEIVRRDMSYRRQALPSDQSIFAPINILKVTDPSLLWIQLVGLETSDALNALIDEMDDFYSGPYGDLYFIRDEDIVRGLVCAAVWSGDGTWCRASIFNVPLDVDYVGARFFDHGADKKVLKRNMKYLRKDFLKLPAQAIKTELAFIEPKCNNQWDSHIHEKLRNVSDSKDLEAKFIPMELGSDSCAIWLQDSSESMTICINESLVEEGLANYSKNINESFINENEGIKIAGVTKTHLKEALSTILKVRAAISVANNKQLLHQILQVLDIGNSHGSPEDLTVVKAILSLELNSSAWSKLGSTQSNVVEGSIDQTGSETCSSQLVSESDSSYLSRHNHASRPTSAGLPSESARSSQSRYFSISPSSINESSQSYDGSAQGTDEPPSTNNNDIDLLCDNLQNDEDEVLDELCYKYANATPKYVQRVILRDRYKIHIIVVNGNPCVSSGDISKLLWPYSKYDYLPERLQGTPMDSKKIQISQCDYSELFLQLNSYKVKGIDIKGSYESIFLYPLKCVLGILNIFGHPSPTIRDEIFEEIRNFDADDEIWDHYSNPGYDNSENEEDVADDFYKMSVYDLRLIVNDLQQRKGELLQEIISVPTPEKVNMIQKFDYRIGQYEGRIKEIEHLSTSFYFTIKSETF